MLNKAPFSSGRKPFHAEVIEVAEKATSLDPVTEVAEVQRLINTHNIAFRAGNTPHASKPWHINRTVLYTGYLISQEDSEKLVGLVDLPTTRSSSHDEDVRILANNIMITPRPCPNHILDKVGGLGKALRWRAVATAVLDNKVWAARVEPVLANANYYTDTSPPLIVLALRGNARPTNADRIQSWQPLPENKSFEFETTVGEKVLLRIDEERRAERQQAGRENGVPSNTYNEGYKRVRPQDEGFPPLGSAPKQQNRNISGSSQQQPRHYGNDENRRPNGQNSGQGRGGVSSGNNSQRGRGGGQRFERRQQNNGGGRGVSRGGAGGGGAGGGGRGRGRGNYASYRSLDDRLAGNGGKGSAGGHGFDGARDDGGLTY